MNDEPQRILQPGREGESQESVSVTAVGNCEPRGEDALAKVTASSAERQRYNHKCQNCGDEFSNIVENCDFCCVCAIRKMREEWDEQDDDVLVRAKQTLEQRQKKSRNGKVRK